VHNENYMWTALYILLILYIASFKICVVTTASVNCTETPSDQRCPPLSCLDNGNCPCNGIVVSFALVILPGDCITATPDLLPFCHGSSDSSYHGNTGISGNYQFCWNSSRGDIAAVDSTLLSKYHAANRYVWQYDIG